MYMYSLTQAWPSKACLKLICHEGLISYHTSSNEKQTLGALCQSSEYKIVVLVSLSNEHTDSLQCMHRFRLVVVAYFIN